MLDEKSQLIQYVQSRWGGPKALRPASEAGRLSFLPTGLPRLDSLLGGGLPAGRITTLSGGGSSGVTSLAHACVAAAQRREYIAVYLDAARTFDPAFAACSGVDLSRLTIIRPVDPEEAMEIAALLARSGGFDLVVFDALTDEYSSWMISRWLGSMVTLLHAANTALLLLTDLKVLSDRALAHYSTLRLETRRSGWMRDRSGDISGLYAQISTTKQKTGAAPGSVTLALRTLPRPSLYGSAFEDVRREEDWSFASSMRPDA